MRYFFAPAQNYVIKTGPEYRLLRECFRTQTSQKTSDSFSPRPPFFSARDFLAARMITLQHAAARAGASHGRVVLARDWGRWRLVGDRIHAILFIVGPGFQRRRKNACADGRQAPGRFSYSASRLLLVTCSRPVNQQPDFRHAGL
jgi:hypothetical protein